LSKSSNKINQINPHQSYTTVKLPKPKKPKILKAVKENEQLTNWGKIIQMIVDFSSEPMEAKIKGHNVLHVPKGWLNGSSGTVLA
jgi:hypothetical protein